MIASSKDRYRRILAVAALGLGVLAACGGGSSSSSSSSTSAASSGATAAPASADAEVFCTALLALSGGTPGPEEVDGMYSDLEANAPVELEASVATFVANARAVTAAFAAAGGSDASVDIPAVLATLTPEQQQLVKDLTAASQAKPIAPGPTADVFNYAVNVCGAPQNESFSSVATAVN